jgi:hypothetical protein
MSFWNETALWWVSLGVGGVSVVAFLWWSLSDLVLAYVDVPFSETVARWRRREEKDD